jgi:RNase adaptor protein for sRNA GlmZ degradation
VASVLVTGMSGTGKSTVLAELERRGHRCVDTDEGDWCETVLDETGSPDRLLRLDEVEALLDTPSEGQHLFVSACASNQGALYERLDAVVLLAAPTDVMLARVATRTTNPFGSRPDERAKILRDTAEVVPILRRRASAELDGTLPVADLADALEALADSAARG